MKQLLLIIHVLLIGLSHSSDSNQNYISPRDLVDCISTMNLPSDLTTGLADLSEVANEVLPHILPKRPVTDATYASEYTHNYVTVSLPYLLERTKKLMQVFKDGYALYGLGGFPEQAYMNSLAGKSGLTCLEYLCFMRTMTKDANKDNHTNESDDLVFDYYIRALKSGEITSHILPFAFHNFNKEFNGIFGEAMMNAAMSCGLFPCMSVCAPQVEYDGSKSGPYQGMLHDCTFHWSQLKQPTLITEYIVGKLRENLRTISDRNHLIHVFKMIHESDGSKGTLEEISHVLNDPGNSLRYIVSRQREISGLCSSSVDDEINQAAILLSNKYKSSHYKTFFMGELTRYLLLDYLTRTLVDSFQSRDESRYSDVTKIALSLNGLSPTEMHYLKEIYAHFQIYSAPPVEIMVELIKIYRRNNNHRANLNNIAITKDCYPRDARNEIQRVIAQFHNRPAFPREIKDYYGLFAGFYISVNSTPQVFASVNPKPKDT